MKNIELELYPDNQELVYEGKKTSTLRTDKQFEKIGLEKGESGLITISMENRGVSSHISQVSFDLDVSTRQKTTSSLYHL